MSFDLHLISFRNGQKSPADAAAARAVLLRHRVEHQREFDSFDVYFDDGSRVELYAARLSDTAGDDKPFGGGMFALRRGISSAIGDFIFEFSRAAGCVIFPAMDPPTVIVPREDLADHLPPDLDGEFHRIPVASGGELLAALSGGFDAWRAFRDQVAKKFEEP